MAIITISDLLPTGFALFSDPENFLLDLVDSELEILGGLASGNCISTAKTCCPNATRAAEAELAFLNAPEAAELAL
jgi:hypothetical protein